MCNLDCKYCFFLSMEMFYPGNHFHMADKLLETHNLQLLEAQQVPEVTFAWQGDEPTLIGLDFYKRSIELVEKYKKPKQTIQHTFQTNGTKIDDDWAAFFKQHNFLVGLGVDGLQPLYDDYRVNKGSLGAAIFIDTLLDNLPESIIPGMSLALGGAINLAFLAAVFVSNLPEGVAGSVNLRAIGRSRNSIFWMVFYMARVIDSQTEIS